MKKHTFKLFFGKTLAVFLAASVLGSNVSYAAALSENAEQESVLEIQTEEEPETDTYQEDDTAFEEVTEEAAVSDETEISAEEGSAVDTEDSTVEADADHDPEEVPERSETEPTDETGEDEPEPRSDAALTEDADVSEISERKGLSGSDDLSGDDWGEEQGETDPSGGGSAVPRFYMTFDANGGYFPECNNETIQTFERVSETAVSDMFVFLGDPVREGHTFLGWYDDPEGEFETNTWIERSENCTVYAKWGPDITVTFVSRDALIRFADTGEEGYILTRKYKYGWAVGESGEGHEYDLPEPVLEGEWNWQWYNDEDLTSIFIEPPCLTADFTYYLGVDRLCHLILHANGGYYLNSEGERTETYDMDYILENTVLEPACYPEAYHDDAGLILDQYYMDAAMTRPAWKYADELPDEVDLYAGWTKEMITVTCSAYDGSFVDEYGSEQRTIESSWRKGTRFDDIKLPAPYGDGVIYGWYADEGLTQPVGDDTVFNSSTTIYARFSETPVPITSWAELQERIDTVQEGETIVLTEDLYATETDTALQVNKKLTIDLNGHVLDRGLTYQEAVFGGSVIQLGSIHNGSVLVTAGELTIRDSSSEQTGAITGGHDSNGGGGINVTSDTSLTLESGKITGNKAKYNGGGVCAWGTGTVTLLGGSIIGNQAERYGGGINLSDTSFCDLNNGVIDGNTASHGGGIFVGYMAGLTMYNSHVINNSALQASGGGVALGNGARFTMLDSEISHNSTESNGGGLSDGGSSSVILIRDSIFEGNQSAGDGGALHLFENAEIENTVIRNNGAARYGGGIHSSGNLTLHGGIITGNKAGKAGGGIIFNAGTCTISGNLKITGNVIDTGEKQQTSNLYITRGKKLTIDGKLQDADIGIFSSVHPSQTGNPVVFTSGLKGNGTKSAFTSDQGLVVAVDGNGEAVLKKKVIFTDVPLTGKYYSEPVYWAAENGITTGYSDGTFGVGRNCERRELMIFLWRFAGCPSGYDDARTMFNDLGSYGPTSATNQAIAWAYKEGITKGYADGGFHPKSSIVRKDVMIMLYRLAEKPQVSGTLTFTDCKGYKQGTDTYNAILWGSNNGITKGYTSGQYAGQFGANLDCLREQIVTFLYRYDQLGE